MTHPYCPLCGLAADELFGVKIDGREWKNVKIIDVPYWAAKKEGWRMFKTATFLGDERAILYRIPSDALPSGKADPA